MAATRKRYRAFISYSQQDTKQADRLHKALERYRVPLGLAPEQIDQETRRLGRFFRDTEDMSAAADISATVRGAIEDSACLIVVCSPRSAGSRWVIEEIEHFRQTGRGDRIYAVIVDGEANSGDPETECFPPALRVDAGIESKLGAMPIEPVGIDLRKQSLARACARIAAGMLDLRFDDLWQRDRRETQRRTLIAAGAGGGVLFAVLAAMLLIGAGQVRDTMARRSAELAEAARLASEQGRLDQAARFALAGVLGSDTPLFGFDAHAAEAELRRALAAGPFRYTIPDAGSLAFSPDGARIVTGRATGEAVVSEVSSGRVLARLPGGQAPVESVFNGDGRRVLTFDQGDNARIWSPSSGSEVAVLRGHQRRILGAAFSSDGARAVTVSEDGGARVWDASNGRQISELRHQGEPVLGAWFMARGTRVLTATYQGAIQVWDVARGRAISSWPALSPEERVRLVRLSPDKTRLYVHSEFPGDIGGAANGLLRLFDTSGRLVAELAAEADPLTSAAFSADSRYLAIGQNDGTAQIWRTSNGAPRARLGERASALPDGALAERAVVDVAFTPAGLLTSVAADRCPRLWSFSNEEIPLFSETNAACGSHHVALNREGSYLALVGHQGEGGAQIWSTIPSNRMEAMAQPSGNAERLTEFGFSGDGARLFTVSERATQVWDVANRRVLATLPASVDALPAFSSDSTQIATASGERAEVWNAETGAPVAHLPTEGASVVALGFDHLGARALVAAGDGQVTVRDIGGRGREAVLDDVAPGEVTALFFRGGSRIFTTITAEMGGFGSVAGAGVWDSVSGGRLVAFESAPPSAYGLAISANGARVLDAFGGHVLDVNTGAIVQTYAPTRLRSRPSIAGLSADGALIATFRADAGIDLRRVGGGDAISTLRGFERLDEDFSSPPVFSRDGRFIAATMSGEGGLWDVQSGRLIGEFNSGPGDGRLGRPQFSPDGALIVVLTDAAPRGTLGQASGRAIGLWRLPTPLIEPGGDLVQRTCAVMRGAGVSRFLPGDYNAAPVLDPGRDPDACKATGFATLVARSFGF